MALGTAAISTPYGDATYHNVGDCRVQIPPFIDGLLVVTVCSYRDTGQRHQADPPASPYRQEEYRTDDLAVVKSVCDAGLSAVYTWLKTKPEFAAATDV